DHAARFAVRVMWRTLQVCASGYCAWLKRPESARARKNRALVVEVRPAHERSQRRYGSPRITHELREAGRRCGKNRIARLMRAHDIRAKRVRKWRATTQSDHRLPVASNTLDRPFTVSRPNPGVAAGMRSRWTGESWLGP